MEADGPVPPGGAPHRPPPNAAWCCPAKCPLLPNWPPGGRRHKFVLADAMHRLEGLKLERRGPLVACREDPVLVVDEQGDLSPWRPPPRSGWPAANTASAGTDYLAMRRWGQPGFRTGGVPRQKRLSGVFRSCPCRNSPGVRAQPSFSNLPNPAGSENAGRGHGTDDLRRTGLQDSDDKTRPNHHRQTPKADRAWRHVMGRYASFITAGVVHTIEAPRRAWAVPQNMFATAAIATEYDAAKPGRRPWPLETRSRRGASHLSTGCVRWRFEHSITDQPPTQRRLMASLNEVQLYRQAKNPGHYLAATPLLTSPSHHRSGRTRRRNEGGDAIWSRCLLGARPRSRAVPDQRAAGLYPPRTPGYRRLEAAVHRRSWPSKLILLGR